jgi:hypothetical protein
MPYITQEQIKELHQFGRAAKDVGELTYMLTYHALQEYTSAGAPEAVEAMNNEIDLYMAFVGEVRYATLCGVVGSIECARREFRRRRPDGYLPADEALTTVLQEFYAEKVAPYEDTKINQNGDVF